MKTIRIPAALIAALGFGIAGQSSLSAQTLTFEGIDWYRGDSSNTTLTSVTDGTLGTALSYDQSADTTLDSLVGTLGSTFVLGSNVGDSVQLSFDFRFTGSFGADFEDNALRFGLYNSNGTAIVDGYNDGGGTTDNNDQGYYGFIANLSTGDYDVALEDATTGVNPSSIGGGSDTNAPLGQAAGFINDTASHSVLLSIARAASGVDITLSVDGSTIVSGNDPTGLVTSFDEIMLNLADGSDAVFNNFSVEAVSIPEPSTYAMCALMFASFAALVWSRRSSRK